MGMLLYAKQNFKLKVFVVPLMLLIRAKRNAT